MNTYLISVFSLRLTYDEVEKITAGKSNVIRINYDESNIDNVLDECSYFSLLNEEKIVIVNNFKIDANSKPLEKYLKNPNPATKLILITNNIDKRNTIYKLIKEKGTIIEINELKPSELTSKINSYAKKEGVMIDYLAVNKLIDYNLNNYDLILSEIDKLKLIKNKITKEDIIDYGSKIIGEENFALCDAITTKNKEETSKLLNDFIQNKEEVTPFIALLASSYRIILAVKSLSNKSNETIAKELNIHPYRVKLAREKASLYTLTELYNIIISLTDLDYKIKSMNVDNYMLLKIFLINI
jgi:DNA polymerase III subunit delta